MKSRASEKKPPIPDKDLQQLLSILATEITERPPTIGLIGVSGVGKKPRQNIPYT